MGWNLGERLPAPEAHRLTPVHRCSDCGAPVDARRITTHVPGAQPVTVNVCRCDGHLYRR